MPQIDVLPDSTGRMHSRRARRECGAPASRATQPTMWDALADLSDRFAALAPRWAHLHVRWAANTQSTSRCGDLHGERRCRGDLSATRHACRVGACHRRRRLTRTRLRRSRVRREDRAAYRQPRPSNPAEVDGQVMKGVLRRSLLSLVVWLFVLGLVLFLPGGVQPVRTAGSPPAGSPRLVDSILRRVPGFRSDSSSGSP